MAEMALNAARDPRVSVSSANPYQTVFSPAGNWQERKQIRENATIASKRLSGRRSFIYSYALRKRYELKYAGIADAFFQGCESV